jgi:serine/threonine protein kinase/tetratricopeptide (TPR) repeat protein
VSLPAGVRLGPYEIVSLIGAGGMGEVYRARDSRLERDVAVKVLPAHLTASPDARERLSREAQAIASLQHPNICTAYDVGETGEGHFFIVMELLQGETLQARLARGRFAIDEILDIASALVDALDVAHRAGIVHRDIKPANVFLTSRGPKILDFGLARRSTGSSNHLQTTAGSPFVTTPGSAIGTLAYMSPEQLRGEEIDARSDLFSLGLVLYEMATGGRPAFKGDTAAAVGGAILHEQPRPPRQVRPDLPEGLEAIILKALEKDRARRYQHASDVLVDFRRLQDKTDRHEPFTAGRRKFLAPIAVAIVVVAALAAYFYPRPRPRLTEKDAIVLAEFENTTGDSVFDGTLRQGLSVQLQQSPYVTLVSDDRIRKTLGLMGRPADARLTADLAREVCERTASAAVLDGSIATLGSQYVLGLRARSCRNGDTIDEQQAQAARKEDVLKSLSDIASTFRTRIGESLATVEQHSRPLAEVTTSSLEALKAFTTANEVVDSSGNVAAVPLFKRAIELDPDFALVYSYFGLVYSALGESLLAKENTVKAYQLRDRVSDRERFFITVTYHRQVTGNLEKAGEAFESWTQTYPNDIRAHSIWSGYATQGAGKYEKSVEEAQKAIALEPDSIFGYTNLAFSYMYLDRFTDAEGVLQQAADRKFEQPELAVLSYFLASLIDDRAGMDGAVDRTKGKPFAEDWLSHFRSLILARSGLAGQAMTMSRTAAELAERGGGRERAALYRAAVANWEGWFGNRTAARRSAMEAIELSRGRDVEYAAALAFALAGDGEQAQAMANDLAREYPEDTSVQFIYLPTLRAQASLEAHDPAKALERLQTSTPYDLAQPGVSFNAFFGGMYSVYLRGAAFLAMNKGLDAAREFQKILDHRGVVVGDPIGVLAHLQIGRAYALAGDTAKAQAAYQEFLTLWKDADADIPVLQQAKAELARLH